MRKNKLFVLVAVLVAFVLLAGCSTFTKNTYSSIKTSAIMVDSAMKVSADLYAEGYINSDDVEEIKAIHVLYRSSYIVAVDALSAYKRSGDVQDKEMLEYAMIEITVLAGDIAVLVDKFLARRNQ